jgi:hypothetical protein
LRSLQHDDEDNNPSNCSRHIFLLTLMFVKGGR